MTELKRCWRCGGRAIYVDEFGIPSDEEIGFVSCHWTPCMPLSEKYTVEQWQKRATEDELEKKITELEGEITFLKNNKAETYVMQHDPQWLPVSIPPTEGKKYWVYDCFCGVYPAYSNGGVFYHKKSALPYIGITHYMSRQGKPKPPK